MAYPSPRHIQFRRGNTAAVSNYVGYVGEITVNTDDWTIRVCDGVTVGGHTATVNTASIIDSITHGNVEFGNLVPSANVTYSLGTITHQWKDLFVSNNTIYMGGIPLSINANGNLTVNGNVIQGGGGGANVTNNGYNIGVDSTGALLLAGNGVVRGPNGGNGPVNLVSSNFVQMQWTANANVADPNNQWTGSTNWAYVDSGGFHVETITPTTDAYLNFDATGNLTISGNLILRNTINFPQSQQIYTSGTGNDDNFIIVTANVQNDINGIQIGEVNQGATIYTSGAVQLYTNTAGASALWAFNTDGTTTFPDSTVQTTAFSNAAVSSYLADTTLKTFGDSVTITGNLTVQGNIIFNGNATLVSTNNLIINDNIIYIANANPGSSLDIGIAGHFTSTRYQHTGLIRQASTNQWQLFSNVVPEPGGTVDFTNAVYDDIRVGNITSPTIIGINANVIAANTGIKGYVDLANTIQSAQLTAANTAWAANASAQQTLISSLQSNAASQETEIQSLFANSYQQQALIGNLQASAYSNINVASYLTSVGIGGGNYSNVNVAAYLNATGYNLYSNVNVAAYLAGTSYTGYSNVNVNAWFSGNIFTSLYSNVNVAAYLAGNVTVGTITTTGNVNANNLVGTSANTTITAGTFVSTFNNAGNVILPNVYVSGNVTANYFLGNGALLTGIVASGSTYGNTQVAQYLQVGNIANVSVAGNVTATYFLGNGSQLTGISSSYSNVQTAAYLNATGYNLYSNTNVIAYLNATGYNLYSNVNLIAYLAGNITTGNVTATGFIGNGAGLTNVTFSQAGNIVGTQTNVTLQAGTFTSVFDNQGNVRLPNVYVSGNVTASYFLGNGALLTGIVASGGGTNYSNVNVASYLGATQILVANIKLNPSGNIIFADGTTQITAAVNNNYGNVNVAAYTAGLTNYSNVNVAAYLNTQGYNLYSNVNVTAYLGSLNPVKLGSGAGTTSQGTDAVAVGRDAGQQQGTESVAIGVIAGKTNQGSWGVAIGSSAGTTNQGQRAIAIGVQSAEVSQGAGAVAIGAYAGDSIQGQYAIAIGTHAGDANQPASSIILNASGSALNGTNAGLYINPVRNDVANVANVVYYNAVTNELTYAPAGSSSYSNVQVATYLPTYSGNIANITLSPSGILTFADGTTQTTAGGGGSNYSNSNVSSYLISSNAIFIGNTGNVSSVYPLQSNIQQFFIGSQTSILSGGALTPAITYLLNNLYYDAAGNQKYRNTQTGATSFSMGSAGFSWAGTTGAVTANAASGIGSWLSLSGSGLVTNNSLPITAAGALTTTSGTLNSGAATAALFNTTATTINLGGVATAINIGSTNGTGNVFFGGNAIITATNGAVGTTLYPLVLRPQGQYNYLLLYVIAGGYNAPPYTAQALTGGSGTGMTASYSTAGNGYVTQASLVVVNPGTGYKNGDVLTLPGGLGTTVILYNYNPAKTSNTAASSYTFGFDGNLTLPGNIIFPSSSYIYGDFSNATVNSRTVFVTTGNSTTTGIYAAPSGTGTGAAWQAANSSNLTAASKIMITTNGSTDVQLVSGINGAGTYLPLSFYNNGAAQMQLTVAGNLVMTVNNSVTTSGTGYFIGNAVGTTATYTGNITALNIFGNISSGASGNLNVVGNLISTGYGFFPGAYNESATTSGVFIGNTGSGTPSPRIGFFNGNTTQNWQIDNYFGQFRWFTPGITQMNLDSTGSLTVTGNVTVNGANGVAMPLRPAFRVIGQGGSITVGGNIVASNWTVDYTQGNSAAYLNGTNGTFTAPVAGLYQTSLTARTTSNTNGSIIQAVIQQIKSGSASVAMMIEWGANTTFNHASGSTTVKLAAGDKLYVTCLASGAPNGTGFSFDGNDHWDVTYLG